MIKYYKPEGYGTHIVRVTFMMEDYVGHVAFPVGGNCKGEALLNAGFLEEDTQPIIECYKENDCEFKFHEDNECYSAFLKNPAGETIEVEAEACDMYDMIVGIEIVDFIPEGKGRMKGERNA